MSCPPACSNLQSIDFPSARFFFIVSWSASPPWLADFEHQEGTLKQEDQMFSHRAGETEEE